MEQRRKPFPQYVDLLEHICQWSKTRPRLLQWQHIHQCFRGRSDTQHGFSRDTMWEGTHEWLRTKRFVDRNTEKRFFHWENKSSLAVLERMSDEHLMDTAAGVMRSRAVRRLQEVTFQERLPTSCTAGAAGGAVTDSSMVILVHRHRNKHVRYLPLRERTASKNVTDQQRWTQC